MRAATLLIAFSGFAACASSFAQRDERGFDRRDEERHAPAREERREPPRAEAHRAPPHFAAFRKGERIAPEYRHPNYVVSDWRVHHLHAPPRGYHWVEVGPDFLLVAIATGVIAEVLANGQQVAAAPPGAPPPPPAPATGGTAGVWYFCPSANAYYPYVNQCPEGWQVVPASPPPGAGQ
jgi:Ni/Co efflux regulator RcnB